MLNNEYEKNNIVPRFVTPESERKLQEQNLNDECSEFEQEEIKIEDVVNSTQNEIEIILEESQEKEESIHHETLDPIMEVSNDLSSSSKDITAFQNCHLKLF